MRVLLRCGGDPQRRHDQAEAGIRPRPGSRDPGCLPQPELPGTLGFTLGDDLGLRDGNWSFAIVSDFADADAYRVYDLDEAHNAARARLAPMIEQAARVQFEIPDS